MGVACAISKHISKDKEFAPLFVRLALWEYYFKKIAPLDSCFLRLNLPIIVPEVYRSHQEKIMTSKASNKSSAPMTQEAAQRIQSATAKANGGSVPKGSFAARATSSAAKRN